MAADDGNTHRTAHGTAATVVVIGVSTGGLDALRTLLGSMRKDSGAAFVVVPQRSAARGSRLIESLRPYTHLTVREAKDGAPLEPNTVLVVPPSAEVAAFDADIHLEPARKSPQAPIDRAFRAVAAACGASSVGVLLTGMGSDGSLGLGAIKDQGGLAVVQDPDEAERDEMPRSAIRAGVVDLVLPLREMPAAIRRYSRTTPQLPTPSGSGGDLTDAFGELIELLDARVGRSMSAYRSAIFERRIAKRMRLHAIAEWPRYLELLRKDPTEADVLGKEVLQSVGNFFGDKDTFERLESSVLPSLFDASEAAGGPLRAWVVGCSTGEQTYSLAITLLEERARRSAHPDVQVFASDISDEALDRARAGTYPSEIEAAIDRPRLGEYFAREDDSYRVRQELRSVVVFARHDVVSDFPFSHLDLVFCRRSLIDNLRPEARQIVLRNFHYSLRPHGVLVVDGGADLDHGAKHLFEAADTGVYRRVAAERQSVVPPPAIVASGIGRTEQHPDEARIDARVVHLALLERYTPASVLVDETARILHYSARASRYLRMPGGEVTHDLLRLLREPLRSAVRGGLLAVKREATPWTSDSLLVHTDTCVRRVAVRVEPAGPGFPANVRLVVFEEVGAGDTLREDKRPLTAADYTVRLGAELDEASRRLKTVVGRESPREPEPSERDVEDEQLAGVLDDLETAKQELRSVNEELITLDQDNRARLEELARLSADLEVLLESTGLATLFVDRELKVVRYTTPLLDIFDVVPSDKGRPLAGLKHRLRNDELLADASRVLRHLTPVEREVEAENGKWYLLRMLPYRSAPQGLGGVAITLVDITSRRNAEQEIRQADRRKDEFIALLAHELRNPLAPISSGIEILKRRNLDPSIIERITGTMSRQAAQLVRLIDDLLDVSRITSGRLQLRKARVTLADIVRDAVAAVKPMVERSNHELVVEVPPEPIVLEADAARLTQVLANLLNNASRYTANGGKIELRVTRERRTAVVTVKDTGYGIPENALPHVFEMFYQGADPRSATQTGLGIGLALAKSLVDMHGGSISAASAGRDCGSEFTLRLPVLEREQAAESPRGPAASNELGGHRVLVVDDNADAARTLAVLIQTLGENDVHVALSGEEALPLAERIKPDTIFLDLKMPEMDGYEVAQRLRREPWGGSTWLVALTGWGLEDHKRRTKEAGFDQHLTKPADRAALEAILARPTGRAPILPS